MIIWVCSLSLQFKAWISRYSSVLFNRSDPGRLIRNHNEEAHRSQTNSSNNGLSEMIHHWRTQIDITPRHGANHLRYFGRFTRLTNYRLASLFWHRCVGIMHADSVDHKRFVGRDRVAIDYHSIMIESVSAIRRHFDDHDPAESFNQIVFSDHFLVILGIPCTPNG